jgi:hypothetical protein
MAGGLSKYSGRQQPTARRSECEPLSDKHGDRPFDSTVFLGINCNVYGTGPPLWFQTAVFRAAADGTVGTEIKYDTLRYSTVADASAGHVVICDKVKTGEIGE